MRTELSAPSIADLRQHFEHENQLWKQGDHYRQGRVRDAYNAWFRASVRAGNPPDALVRKIEDETERFLDRVLPGLDGCSYWTGFERFVKNDGTSTSPRRWWYQHANGPVGQRDAIKPTCGDHQCIAPPHMDIASWSEAKRQYSDQACIGALQVAAMKLGHTPTIKQYEALGLLPASNTISARFNSWTRALDAAGLEPVLSQTGRALTWSDEACLDALRKWKTERGVIPIGYHWTREKTLPSEYTIRRRFGSWNVALVRAGLK